MIIEFEKAVEEKTDETVDTDFEELMEQGFELLFTRLTEAGASEEDAITLIERLIDALNNDEAKERMAKAIAEIMMDYVDFSGLPSISPVVPEVLHE